MLANPVLSPELILLLFAFIILMIIYVLLDNFLSKRENLVPKKRRNYKEKTIVLSHSVT